MTDEEDHSAARQADGAVRPLGPLAPSTTTALDGPRPRQLGATAAMLLLAGGWGPTGPALLLALALLAGAAMAFVLLRQRARLRGLQQELRTQMDYIGEQERQLARQRTDLEEKGRRVEDSDRLKSAFIANMSHEIRTPLNSVLALSHLLRSGNAGALTAAQRKYLEIIERNGESLLRLISDILDLSRIDSGHLQIDSDSVDLASRIQEVVASLTPLASAKGIDILVKVPDDLPAAVCDRYRLSQVLTNLVGNAIKFTERGHIVISAEVRDNLVAVHVADTGIGIPRSAMPNLFQEFFQVDQTMARRRTGTGLGLAIASRLVKLMGGDLTVESATGIGSKFSFTLPRSDVSGREVRERTPPEQPPAPAVSEAPATSSLPPATVLVVEDNEDNLFTVRQALAPMGLDIVAATSGREAIDLVKLKTPDLVLMDVQMPGMSGLQATGAIRRLPGCQDVPIIALTAQAMKGDRERILAAGCNDYVSKPIQPRVLQEVIRRHLHESRRTPSQREPVHVT